LDGQDNSEDLQDSQDSSSTALTAMTTSGRGRQVKCNRGIGFSWRISFRFNARDRNHRAVSRATALDGHYPRTQPPPFDMELWPGWDGWMISSRWYLLHRNCNCNYIWQRSYCGPTARCAFVTELFVN